MLQSLLFFRRCSAGHVLSVALAHGASLALCSARHWAHRAPIDLPPPTAILRITSEMPTTWSCRTSPDDRPAPAATTRASGRSTVFQSFGPWTPECSTNSPLTSLTEQRRDDRGCHLRTCGRAVQKNLTPRPRRLILINPCSCQMHGPASRSWIGTRPALFTGLFGKRRLLELATLARSAPVAFPRPSPRPPLHAALLAVSTEGRQTIVAFYGGAASLRVPLRMEHRFA